MYVYVYKTELVLMLPSHKKELKKGRNKNPEKKLQKEGTLLHVVLPKDVSHNANTNFICINRIVAKSLF